jgi:uncharacterized protein with PQ loop repeat
MIVTMLGWIGAILSCLLVVPQAVRAVRSERLDGISATTHRIVLTNAIVWATWSILAEQYAAGVPSAVSGPAAVVILHRLRRTMRTDCDAPTCHGVRASRPVRRLFPARIPGARGVPHL